MVLGVMRARLRLLWRSSAISAVPIALVATGVCVVALLLVLFVAIVASIAFTQAQRSIPGAAGPTSLAVVMAATWLVTAAVSVSAAYHQLFRDRDAIALSAAPVSGLRIYMIELLTLWLRAAGIPLLFLLAVGLGWIAAQLRSGIADVMWMVYAGFGTVTSAVAAGISVAIALTALIGRDRMDELKGLAPFVVLALVLLAQPDTGAAGAQASQTPTSHALLGALSWVGHLPLPSTWLANAIVLLNAHDPLAAARSACGATLGIIAWLAAGWLALTSFYLPVLFTDQVSGSVRPRRLVAAGCEAIMKLGVVGVIAVRDLRLAWRETEQRVQLVAAPILLPIYVVRLPVLLGASLPSRPQDAMLLAPLVFGVLGGSAVANRMSLTVLTPQGAGDWMTRTSASSAASIASGRLLGALLRSWAVTSLVCAVCLLVTRATADAALVASAAALAGAAAVAATNAAVGGLAPPAVRVDPSRPTATAAIAGAVASVCVIAIMAALLLANMAWLSVLSGCVTAAAAWAAVTRMATDRA